MGSEMNPLEAQNACRGDKPMSCRHLGFLVVKVSQSVYHVHVKHKQSAPT